jgi:presenilin-like A22 family membrane protease
MRENGAFLIILMFLITQLLGLYVGNEYFKGIKVGVFEPAIPEPEKVESSFMLFFYILITTAAILLTVRVWKGILRGLEAFVIFFSSWFVFDFLFPFGLWIFSIGFILAILLTLWKVIKPSILTQNVAAVISGAGVGSLLGASLGLLPSLVFIILLSIYDFISVFITKHMVRLAKIVTEKPTAFTIAAPHRFKKPKYIPLKKRRKKVHVFQLGVGDMVVPLMFSVSLLSRFSILNSIITMIGSLIALSILIIFTLKKPRVLPALPFITLGTLGGFLISIVIL